MKAQFLLAWFAVARKILTHIFFLSFIFLYNIVNIMLELKQKKKITIEKLNTETNCKIEIAKSVVTNINW